MRWSAVPPRPGTASCGAHKMAVTDVMGEPTMVRSGKIVLSARVREHLYFSQRRKESFFTLSFAVRCAEGAP